MTTPSRKGLSRFITTEAISPEYQDSYEKIWDAVRSAFNTPRPESVGYWRYPLFLQVGDRRKEPDILIVDREWGIITIEVCTATIEQISWLDGNNINFYEQQLTDNFKINNLSKYVQVLRKYCDLETIKNQESNINNKVIGKTLIAFPYISTDQWQSRGWQGIEEGSPFIFNNQLGEVGLKKRIEKANPIIEGESLNEQQYKSLLSVISGTSILRKPLEKIESAHENCRYNILAEAQKLMYDWDQQQEWIGKSIPPGLQEIRGIAGSGKTVLLSQKAVIAHLKYPNWKVAFIFFTRSLYDQIERLFELWIDHFTNGEIKFSNEENSNLRVLHAWGDLTQRKNFESQDESPRNGFYLELCKQFNRKAREMYDHSYGVRRLPPNETRQDNPNYALAFGCRDFLQTVYDKEHKQFKVQFQEIFNAVISDTKYGFDMLVIDEGQDLIALKDDNENSLLYNDNDQEEKQTIYWLAYQSLRPVNLTEIQKRLIWGYDEAQTIHFSGKSVGYEPKFLFGENFSKKLNLSGNYLGGIQKVYIMKRCYRTPSEILMIAYALGVGLLREQGILKPEKMTKKNLRDNGFEVAGKISSNAQITITRPKENSPNSIPDLWQDSVMEFNTYNSREEELLALVEKIKFNLEEDKLKRSRNILVIALGYTTPPYTGNKLETEVAQLLMEKGVDIYIPSALEINELNPKYPNNNPDLFWHNDAITVSRIDRTKGNEADMVYVVGLDNIAKNESDPKLRNQLFVALTRSRGWVHLSGIGDYPFYQEVRKVMEQKDTFTFTIKGVTPPEDANDDLTEEDENEL